MKITKSEFGTTKNGSIINLFHLENTSGAYVEIIDFGCRLTKIVVPDRNGDPLDVCLGFSTADHYADDDASLGAVVGRVANRIKDGHFSLNGKETLLVTFPSFSLTRASSLLPFSMVKIRLLSGMVVRSHPARVVLPELVAPATQILIP